MGSCRRERGRGVVRSKLRKRARQLASVQGQVARAEVSWIGWKVVFCGFRYAFDVPFIVSVTVSTTFTLVSPPAKPSFPAAVDRLDRAPVDAGKGRRESNTRDIGIAGAIDRDGNGPIGIV